MSVCEKNGPPGVNRWLAAYTIVHGVEASPVERTAAELQRYLETITGIRLPVTNAAAPPSPCEFLIGRTGRSFRADVAGLTDDGFAVRRCGGLTAIEGTCGRSTLYGVYYFLETYGGCRFYARDCEVLPSPEAFRLPDAIDDRCSPALSFRDVDWFEAHDAAFAAKLRINSDHNRCITRHTAKPCTTRGIALYIPFRRFCRRNPGLKATRNISRCGRTGNGIGGRCV